MKEITPVEAGLPAIALRSVALQFDTQAIAGRARSHIQVGYTPPA